MQKHMGVSWYKDEHEFSNSISPIFLCFSSEINIPVSWK